MARRKKKRSRSRKRTGKKSRGYAKAKPLGATAGAAGSGLSIMFGQSAAFGNSPVDRLIGYVKGTDSLQNVVGATKDNLTNVNNYKWALIGIGLSASKRLPLIKMVGKPIDRVARDMTRGKWGL